MPTKVLYVGDPHARPDCLEEMRKLIDFIAITAVQENVSHIVFLGDLFHTHSVIHLSVLAFWREAFAQLCKLPLEVVVLVGNHDMSGRNGDKNNALMLYERNNWRNSLCIVDRPKFGIIDEDVMMLPYYKDNAEFVEVCNENPTAVVVCHQTFDGSKYENGFPAKDGVELNLIPQKVVISGHIHTPQQIGKVWYPGSPRWQTISDANIDRAIWVVEHDKGAIKILKGYSTHKVCKPIELLVDRPEEPAKLPDYEAEVIVDVFGEPAHVKQRAEELEKLGYRVRQFPTLTKPVRIKESDGLPESFKKFIGSYSAKNGTPAERLMEMASKRISWLGA